MQKSYTSFTPSHQGSPSQGQRDGFQKEKLVKCTINFPNFFYLQHLAGKVFVIIFQMRLFFGISRRPELIVIFAPRNFPALVFILDCGHVSTPWADLREILPGYQKMNYIVRLTRIVRRHRSGGCKFGFPRFLPSLIHQRFSSNSKICQKNN